MGVESVVTVLVGTLGRCPRRQAGVMFVTVALVRIAGGGSDMLGLVVRVTVWRLGLQDVTVAGNRDDFRLGIGSAKVAEERFQSAFDPRVRMISPLTAKKRRREGLARHET